MLPTSFGVHARNHRLDAVESERHNFPFFFVKRRRRAFILAWGSAPGMWKFINQALKARLIVRCTHSFDVGRCDDATYGEYGFR